MGENQNKPAFPISEEETDRIDAGVEIYTGLTKREYAAIKAMQGILSSRGLQDALNQDRIEWEDFAIQKADKLLAKL